MEFQSARDQTTDTRSSGFDEITAIELILV